GVHARCLIAIPMFLLAEVVVDRYLPLLMRYFAVNGLVAEATVPKFREVLRSIERLRDSSYGLIFMGTIVVIAMASTSHDPQQVHEVAWAVDQAQGRTYLLAAGFWYLFVSRPIFVFLLVQWLWRLILIALLFRRISSLELALVPSHPDGSGGLGFLQNVPI